MSKDINVSTSREGDVAVINITGDVTAVTGQVVKDAYQNDNVSENPKILLAFDKECYINSGGLAFLIDIASEARKKDQKMHASGLSEHFQKIFHMIGLTRCMSIYDTADSAMEEF
ncbi:STAS domain-containing protein [Thermodesulfobacteriota bacterium]